jgi:hypothetical protein
MKLESEVGTSCWKNMGEDFLFASGREVKRSCAAVIPIAPQNGEKEEVDPIS